LFDVFIPQSAFFRFSILRTFRLLRVFRPFRHNNTILLSVYSPLAIRVTDHMSNSTIEVMYVSVRRSRHALLAIGFFVSMVLTVFSTLLYVVIFSHIPPNSLTLL
jgi:potassium voltage-gated channel Shal-related subfamily D member 2